MQKWGVKGVVMAYFKVFHYLPRDNKKNHENFGQNN
jgi:hypothetical protein